MDADWLSRMAPQKLGLHGQILKPDITIIDARPAYSRVSQWRRKVCNFFFSHIIVHVMRHAAMLVAPTMHARESKLLHMR
jgi:hypothetical protein